MEKRKPLVLILLVFGGLLSGVLRAALAPKEINSYENRPARQLPAWSLRAYDGGDYQDGVEAALSDQIPFSQYFKKVYNELSSEYLRRSLSPILETYPDTVASYNDMRIYQGYLLYSRYSFQGSKPLYDRLIESYNAAIAANPDTNFFFYYIETDTTCDFVSSAKNESYTYLKEGLRVSEAQIGRLEVPDFETFREYFRKTDHHWNHKGSYRGYRNLLGLLGVEEEPLRPAEERILTDRYAGTKAATAQLPRFTEEAAVYFFDYPDLGIRYGNEELYRAGERSGFQYGDFYGGDRGETLFDTGRPEREDILVIGDSFDNAVLKLLASHFGKTWSVDLRYYADENGEAGLNVTEYIRRHDIDKVLVIGSDFLFLDETFAVRS